MSRRVSPAVALLGWLVGAAPAIPRTGEDFPSPPEGDVAAQARWAVERMADSSDAAREAGARMLLGLAETSVPALLEATRSSPWRVRARAFDLLVALGSAIPSERLRAGLADENRAVRSSALRAVGSDGTGGTAAAVAALLEDPFHDVRIEAARAALALRRGGGDGPGLLGRVAARLGDPDAGVREAAGRALLGWGEQGKEVVVARLLDPRDPPTLERTLRFLLDSGETPIWVAAPLFRLSREPDLPPGLRYACACAAALAGDDRGELLPRIVAGFLGAGETWISDGCAEALRFRGAAAAPAIAAGLLTIGAEPVRFQTGLALLAAADPQAAPELLLDLLEALPPGDISRRAEVCRALPERRGAAGRLRRIALLERGGESRAAAVAAVARMEGKEGLSFLVERLADPDPGVRRAAFLSAAPLGGAQASEALATALVRETDREARREFVEAVSRHVRTPAIRDRLASLARDPDPAVRTRAVAGLSRFHEDPLAVRALARAYEAERAAEAGAGPTERGILRNLRAAIVTAVALVGGEESFRFLTEVVESLRRDENEQDVTRIAVLRLGQTERGIPCLRSLLAGDTSLRVKVEAALALAPLGDETATGILMDRFASFDVELRGRAVEAIGRRGDDGSLWFLSSVGADKVEGESVRGRALEALAPFASREEVRVVLQEAVRKEGALGPRLAAVHALAEGPRGEAAEALRAWLATPGELLGEEGDRLELLREIAFALARVGTGIEASILAGLAFDGPLARWRESLRYRIGAGGFAAHSRYDLEEAALRALESLGPFGETAVRERVEAGFRSGSLFLADPTFLLLAGKWLRSSAPSTALRLLGIAGRGLAEEPGLRLEALQALAETAEGEGRFEEAAAAYAAALRALLEREVDAREVRALLGEEDPTSFRSPRRALAASAALLRGLAAFARGDDVGGARAFDQALAAAEADFHALGRVALRFAERPGLAERSVEIARRAAEMAPSDRETREILGWCWLRAGDPAGAHASFEAAIALPDPADRGDAPAKFGLAAALVALGREEEGTERLAESLREAPSLREGAERSPFFESLRATGRFPPPAPEPK